MRLWRVVKDPNGRVEDFLSAQAVGRKPRNGLEERLLDGLSMFDSEELAVRKANAVVRTRGGRRERLLGDYVVPVDLPEEMGIRHERTTESQGHHTVWIAPELALALAAWAEVRPVALGVPDPARVGASHGRGQERPGALNESLRGPGHRVADSRDGPPSREL